MYKHAYVDPDEPGSPLWDFASLPLPHLKPWGQKAPTSLKMGWARTNIARCS